MFNSPPVNQQLETAITKAHDELKGYPINTKEYEQGVDQLTKLYAIQGATKPDRISKDTLALIFGNLAGIGVIVGYESKNVIVTKALSFIGKLH